MYDSLIALTSSIAMLAAGLMAGVYFAFSAFIMRAFDRLGPAHATAAMNAINDVILRSWFMPLFFGSSLLYATLAIFALFDTDLDGRWWLFAAGTIYVIGMFLCTALFNVPLNNRLAAAVNDECNNAGSWQHYMSNWTRWNHLRGLCSLVTVILSLQWLLYPG
jgi:uncharacterized membrane protein